jgi:hypothetical protein
MNDDMQNDMNDNVQKMRNNMQDNLYLYVKEYPKYVK